MTLTFGNDHHDRSSLNSSTVKVLLTLTTKKADYSLYSPDVIAEYYKQRIFDSNVWTTHEDNYYTQSNIPNGQTEHWWLVRKSLLTQHSPYFAAMLNHDFYESTTSVICLPSTILDPHGVSSVIQYMYNSRDLASTTAERAGNSTTIINTHNDDEVECQQQQHHTASTQDTFYLLQDTYAAADYFGMADLCIKVADSLGELVHRWSCHCDDCLELTPQLFDFVDSKINLFGDDTKAINQVINSYINKNIKTPTTTTTLAQHDDHHLFKLYAKTVLSLTHDPEKCLPTFWTHRMMARMLDQLPSDHSLMLLQRLCKRISKSNAIESLHACFLATTTLSTLDPLLCWSRSLHSTLASVQAKSTLLIARHFEYYCSQYPALLSCIDGITYSFDFLEYLFMHLLEDQMDLFNAGLLYQGLVRDLICRHAVQYHGQVKHILNVAKDIILQYMSTRLDQLRKQAALDILDTNVLKQLAIELDVPAKSFLYSMEKHQDLVQQSLLTILFPPPKISYPSSSSVSINMSRRSSTTTQRTRSLQSNATSTYSTNHRLYNNGHHSSSSPAFVQWVKGWLGDHHHHRYPQQQQQQQSHQSSSSTPALGKRSCNKSETKSTLFSWTTVPLRSPKKKRGLLHRILHSDVLMNKQAQRKAMIVVVGKRVQLNRRPVLTVGTVKYVGTVSFAEGIWVGVELDRRVGKNDGSIEGERYFTTSPNRGVFVRSDDLKVMF
ncbi:unnamed protein product [Absidia cylindrospora]